MATQCITPEAQAAALRDCSRGGQLTASGAAACSRARTPVCPPPDVAPIIEAGKDGINLLGVYQICAVKPTTLAPYPPSRPLPNEALAQAALERQSGQALRQSSELLKLKSRAARARKIELSPGFWLGLGLVGLGGAVLYFRR